MAYPRENLAPGEVVVLHRHPHWKRLFWPFVIFLVVTAIAGVLAGITNSSSQSSTTKTVLLIVIGVFWVLGFIWYFISPLVSWKTTHFVLTDRRVIFRNGIITRSGIDIPIRRINTVEFRHGPIDRMLRTGTLIIESASDDPLSFDDIPQVERVHSMLYNEVLATDDDAGAIGHHTMDGRPSDDRRAAEDPRR